MPQARVSFGLFDRPSFLCLKRHLDAVMMKHSALIRNKGSVIFATRVGSWNFFFGGEHKILGDKKGEHKKFPLKRGEQKIFMKRISRFYPLLVLKSAQKPFFLNIYHEKGYHGKYSCRFAAKNSQYFL